MRPYSSVSRRSLLGKGLASAAVAGVITPAGLAETPEQIPRKAPGETRVLFLGGDRLHNYYAQEPALRSIAEQAGWNFLSTHDARTLTPDLVATADLLMIERYGSGGGGGRGEGWVPGPVQTKAPTSDGYMSAELEATIVENVTVRGMAYISVHCGIWALTRPKYLDMLGIRPIIHGPLQPVRCQNFNQDHPITRGMKPFDIALDENFGVEPLDSRTIPLYEVYGHQDKRQDVGGWCTEKSKGRVAGLLAGHTYFAFQNPHYLKLFQRAMYWTLRRDIPADA
jgi:hypothetical protein